MTIDSRTVTLPDELTYRVSGHIGWLELNRPHKLNTMTPDMGRALLELVQAINLDETVRVVVLSGAGSKAFSAGSDIHALDGYGTPWQLRNRIDYARGIWSIRKPVIAKIRGFCIGGGLEMALMSDIRYATEGSVFGAGEIKLGWHGGAGNTQLLPRVMPLGRACEMLYTGDLVPASDAAQAGLVDRVFSEEALDSAVAGLAERIAQSAPIAVQLSKHLVRMAMSSSLEVGLAYENDTFAFCFTTEDSNEGRSAFSEKRQPQFKGQ